MRPHPVSEETDGGRAKLGREIHVLTNAFQPNRSKSSEFDYLQILLFEKTILHD